MVVRGVTKSAPLDAARTPCHLRMTHSLAGVYPDSSGAQSPIGYSVGWNFFGSSFFGVYIVPTVVPTNFQRHRPTWHRNLIDWFAANHMRTFKSYVERNPQTIREQCPDTGTLPLHCIVSQPQGWRFVKWEEALGSSDYQILHQKKKLDSLILIPILKDWWSKIKNVRFHCTRRSENVWCV
jgi:hypothetical protein